MNILRVTNNYYEKDFKINEVNIPCPSFNIAAVIKMLNTFLKTSSSKIELGCPEPFQAIMIIALVNDSGFECQC